MDYRKLLLSATALAILTSNATCSFAQDLDRENESAELKKRQFLFDKFIEIGQKAEDNKDYATAVGMYEAASERIIRKEQHVVALSKIARCYTKLGYFWRVDSILDKLSIITKQDPQLISESLIATFRDQIIYLNRIGRKKEGAKCLAQLNRIIQEQGKRQVADTATPE